MIQQQLFRLVRDFSFPEPVAVHPSTGEYLSTLTTIPAAFAICWPDGRPCCLVEMYLLDKWTQYTTRRLDGGSLRVLASHLSHLLRYAYEAKVQLWDFDDMHMRTAISRLQSERKRSRPNQHRRDNNTTRSVIRSWIAFFEWLQVRLQCKNPIVGLEDAAPRIPLQLRKRISRYGHVIVSPTYRFTPPPVAHEDVRGPIARALKLRLWEAVARMAHQASSGGRICVSPELEERKKIAGDYIRKRRELILELLEATGARPSELARLSLEKNRLALAKSQLILSTLKRRKAVDPERIIPLDRAVAMRIEVFISKHRAKLIRSLREAGCEIDTHDHLLLTCKGTPFTEAALEKEFPRIVRAAGLQDERACMSMFRHRFITNMVKLHLIEFMSESPLKRGRQFMTESDYRTILKRVAVFTGHGDEQSLLSYIDLAWAELGIFDYVEPARTLASTVESALDHISGMLTSLRSQRPTQDAHLLREVADLLSDIRNATLAALEPHESSKTLKA